MSEYFNNYDSNMYNMYHENQNMSDENNGLHTQAPKQPKKKKHSGRAGRTASALRILSMIGRGRDGTVAGRFRKSASAKEIVRKIQIYVICNSCRKLTLADAAMHAGMSRAGFCSFWKRETGETFMSFVTRHRLETACRLLKDPSLQVSYVCYESGFNDIPHFNRSFRRRFGVSPSAYRAGLKTE